MSPKLVVSLTYFRYRGSLPKLSRPDNLSEFILAQVVSGEITNYSAYVDKLGVRAFIESIGYGDLLPRLIGEWPSADHIPFESLPAQFALKTNHGCGSHVICADRTELDEEYARAVIRGALNSRPDLSEPQYGGIAPRCFAEELIDDGGTGAPTDYKFMTFAGQVRGILVVGERETGAKVALYDTDWNRIDGSVDPSWEPAKPFPRPDNLDSMVDVAKTIAAHFPQVRVDLYSLPGGRIIIGELTFTPQGGYMTYFTERALALLGPGAAA